MEGFHPGQRLLYQRVLAPVINAAKCTDEGGDVELAVSHQEHEVVVSVRDNGVGIEANLLPYVFDLIVQADRAADRTRSGLGIGLTMVKQLVEMYGGRVEAHSDGPGKGSEFVIRLPAMSEREQASVSTQQSGEGLPEALPRRILVVDEIVDTTRWNTEYFSILVEFPWLIMSPITPDDQPGWRCEVNAESAIQPRKYKMHPPETTILLVDDEDLVRDVARRMLELAGYTVLEAPSAQQALATSRVHGGAIQLLISDIQMPGMSGVELAAEMERERPGIRILLISGYAGINGARIKYPRLDKPFTMDELLRKVAEVLGTCQETRVSLRLQNRTMTS